MLVLIMPIGLPGVGKTTIGLEIQKTLENIKDFTVFISSRDELYKECKSRKLSRKETKFELQNRLNSFINQIKIYHMKNQMKKVIVYMDSSNIFKVVRDKIILEINPNKILYLNFIIPQENIFLLYERLKMRKNHPTFPKDLKEQKRIVENIKKGLEYEKEEENILNLTFNSTIKFQIEKIIEKILE